MTSYNSNDRSKKYQKPRNKINNLYGNTDNSSNHKNDNK